MDLSAPISTIMTKNLITVSENDPLTKIEEIFNEFKIHHIPVVDKGKLIGMVSKSDYLFFKRGYSNEQRDRLDSKRLKSKHVKDIMTQGLAKLAPNDKIAIALEVFKENLFHGIPIVEDEAIVGIVTTLDIIKHLSERK